MSQNFSIGQIDSIKKAYFLGDTNEFNKKTTPAIAETEDKQKLTKSAKYILGATAISATVLGGLLLKKYTNPSSANFKFFQKIGGHFEKGKAFIKQKAYTGKLWSVSKDGEMRIIEYKDGLIQNSQKYSKNLLSKKEYFYHPNGKLKEVQSYSADSNGKMSLVKRSTFSPNGSSRVTNADGKVISSVKVKADEPLAYGADVCIFQKGKNSTYYTYFKDGKKIIKDEIRIDGDDKYIWTKDFLTGENTSKKVYKDGSYDILNSGSWVSKGYWHDGKVEHFDSKGNPIGFSEITSTSKHFDGPDSHSYRGSRTETQYEYKKYDASHKLVDYDSHTETDWWEPYDMTYF